MKRMIFFAFICILAGTLLWAADPPLLINYQASSGIPRGSL